MSVTRHATFKDTAFVVSKSVIMPSADRWNLIVGAPPIRVTQKNYLTKTLPRVKVWMYVEYASRHLNTEEE